MLWKLSKLKEGFKQISNVCVSILMNLLNTVPVSIPYDWYVGKGTVNHTQFPKYFYMARKFDSGQIFFQKRCYCPLGHAQIVRESPI